jgi:hypothetical protein
MHLDVELGEADSTALRRTIWCSRSSARWKNPQDALMVMNDVLRSTELWLGALRGGRWTTAPLEAFTNKPSAWLTCLMGLTATCHPSDDPTKRTPSAATRRATVSAPSGLKSPLLASNQPSDRPTLHLGQASDHQVLKASSWRVSIWIQTERRIDRRCPHSDRRIIRCYCLPCSSSATRPTLLNNGSAVHPTVPRVWPCAPTRPTIAPTLVFEEPSVHPTVSSLFLFLLGFDPCFLHFCM